MRFSENTEALLEKLRRRLGLNTTAVIELAIRHLSESDHVNLPPKPDQDR